MDNKNLPAYPHTSWEDIGKGAAMFTPERLGGFTKRELIAAMCLQGMLSNSQTFNNPHSEYNNFPEWAVKYADNLLIELENSSK